MFASDLIGAELARLVFHRRLVPKGRHAHIVERHHEVVRDLLHKIQSQLEHEGILLDDVDIISEAMLAKNTLLNVGGVSPYNAVFGRSPNMLADFEGSAMNTLAPEGSTESIRGQQRLREIALESMIGCSARDRIRRALSTNTRPAGEHLNLQLDSLVDFHRKPTGEHSKDTSGWQGPARVCDLSGLDAGSLSVRWQGRVINCDTADVRRHLVLLCFLSSKLSKQGQVILRYISLLTPGSSRLVPWHYYQQGWRASRELLLHGDLYQAAIQFAHQELALVNCLGIRYGYSVNKIAPLPGIDHQLLVFWHEDSNRYEFYRSHGNETISMESICGTNHTKTRWVQFLCSNDEQMDRLYEEHDNDVSLPPRDRNTDVPPDDMPDDVDLDDQMPQQLSQDPSLKRQRSDPLLRPRKPLPPRPRPEGMESEKLPLFKRSGDDTGASSDRTRRRATGPRSVTPPPQRWTRTDPVKPSKPEKRVRQAILRGHSKPRPRRTSIRMMIMRNMMINMTTITLQELYLRPILGVVHVYQ